MSEDNIRQIWSEAELDDALGTLNSDVQPATDLSGTRAMLMQAAADTADGVVGFTDLSEPVPAKKSGPWRWLAVAAAVAVVSGGLVVAREVSSHSDPGQVVAPADSGDSGPLGRLTGADVPVPAGKYRLTMGTDWAIHSGSGPKGPVSFAALYRTLTWIPSDPNGTWRRTKITTGYVRWYIGDVAAATAAGMTMPALETNTTDAVAGTFPEWKSNAVTSPAGGWVNPTAAFVAALPTDPAKLLERLRTDWAGPTLSAPHSGPNAPGESFDMAQSVLTQANPPGKLRVAFAKALSQVPGVTMTLNGTTSDGRPGIVFSVNRGNRSEILLDPVTAEVLSIRAFDPKEVNPNVPTPGLLNDVVFTTSIVGRPGEAPTTTGPGAPPTGGPPPPMSTR